MLVARAGLSRRSAERQTFLSLLDMLGDKWTLLVVNLLAAGPLRFSEIGRQVDGISNKALSRTLKNLEARGLVDRRQFLTIPPKVIYSLTIQGATLADPLGLVLDWAHLNSAAKQSQRL